MILLKLKHLKHSHWTCFDQVKVIGNDKHYVYVSFGSSSLFGQIHQSKFDDNKSLLDYSIDLLINLESLDLTKLIIC